MNVLFVSECSGAALKETRRILDQFAERRGERTWQTPITMDGLEAVHKLLRKSARKNTAVACHWIRGTDHSELVWVVGNRNVFNWNGAVATNTTRRNYLRSDDENNWHSLNLIAALSSLSALLHDLGKSCSAFQTRLKQKGVLERNLYRHEWISLRLFQSFVGDCTQDSQWLSRLSNPTPEDDSSWTNRICKDGLNNEALYPFLNMPPLAKAIGWLVLTHHRLPVPPESRGVLALDEFPEKITSNWNEVCNEANLDKITPYWTFEHRLPVMTPLWKKRASRVASRLISLSKTRDNFLNDPYLMHISRLCLMLADHHYSWLEKDGRVTGEPGYQLWANTNFKGDLKQPLDEHLLGVELFSSRAAYALPVIAEQLPRLIHRQLKKRTSEVSFQWQNKAFDLASKFSHASITDGAFIVNMASTGCGKTMANARIMYALNEAQGEGMRCAFAVGLRTLTRQTGEEYKKRLSLTSDQVAILMGGGNVELLRRMQGQRAGIGAEPGATENSGDKTDLEESPNSDNLAAEAASLSGSESMEPLVPEDQEIVLDIDNESNPSLTLLMQNSKASKLLNSPIVVCTVDHLVPATESSRGGHQIAPMLRLLSSDLVLDEIDDYDVKDIPAIARLMNWAGMLGSRVLISSATLPPDLVLGLFEAYKAGRVQFHRNRAEYPAVLPQISCLWVDEYSAVGKACFDNEYFAELHQVFTESRKKKLALAPRRRNAEILDICKSDVDSQNIFPYLVCKLVQGAINLHELNYDVDPVTQQRISFGLIRCANINALFDIALHFYSQRIAMQLGDNYKIHLCVYHSQHPMFVRSAIEAELDNVLKRHKPERVFQLASIRKRLDTATNKNHLFIVLGSPIAEVGRDHDYNWAIVEPSSMRSLIQISGRVRRHRLQPFSNTNLQILNLNVKALQNAHGPVYWRPGFESEKCRLEFQEVTALTTLEERSTIDSRPRITKNFPLNYRRSLVDLEHWRLNQLFFSSTETDISRVDLWWSNPKNTLNAVLQRAQRFREQTQESVDVQLRPSRGGRMVLCQWHEKTATKIDVDRHALQIPSEWLDSEAVRPWAHPSYETEMLRLAGLSEITLDECAKKFSSFTLPKAAKEVSTHYWRWHEWLGYAKYKSAPKKFF